jgi:hypothetical protein
MKKGCLIAAGCAVVLIAVVVVLVFQLTGGAVDAAGKFLAQIGDGKVTEAYQSTSSTFQAQQSLAQFTSVVQRLGLNHFKSASWSNRSVDGNQASLEGTAKTADGGAIPLVMKLFKENGTWKVQSISTPQAGANIGTPQSDIPGDAELKQMVTASILDLDQAVQAEDFTQFRAKTAVLWQQQATAEQLKASFQSFIDKEVHLGGVKDVAPEFDTPPAVNTDHVLVATGHYPTNPSQVKFTIKYIKEGDAWKLIGINVKIGAA